MRGCAVATAAGITTVHALAAEALQPAGKMAACPVALCLAPVHLWKRVLMVLAGSSLTTYPQRLRQQREASSSCGRRIWRLSSMVR